MPVFVVEDGTGLSNATSYVEMAFADDYLGSSWAGDVTAKENALMAGTEYADAKWGPKLMGRPLNNEQALEFPRLGVYDRYGRCVTGVPIDWMKAVCLYAQESVAGTLYPSGQTGNAKNIKRTKKVVGPLSTEIEYQGSATASTFLEFPLADQLAKQYVYGYGSGRVIRN